MLFYGWKVLKFIPHRQKSCKVQSKSDRNRKIDTTNTNIHGRSHSWLGTGTSMKSDEVKLFLWAQISPLSEMKRSCKYIPHESKISTLTYN